MFLINRNIDIVSINQNIDMVSINRNIDMVSINRNIDIIFDKSTRDAFIYAQYSHRLSGGEDSVRWCQMVSCLSDACSVVSDDVEWFQLLSGGEYCVGGGGGGECNF